MAIDPASGTLYVASNVGVSKSTDDGATWTDASKGLTDVVRALALDPAHPSTLYVSTNAGVFKTSDGAASWNRLTSSPPYVQTLAISPRAPSTLFAGTYGSNLFKTTDGGATWLAVTGIGIRNVYAIAIDPVAPGTIYLGGEPSSPSTKILSQSTNDGATWKTLDIGPEASQILSIAIHPSAPSTVYVVQWEAGGPGVLSKLLRSTNAGLSWTAVSDGLPVDPQPFWVAVDPGSPMTVYVGAGSSLYRSRDGGLKWNLVTAGVRPPSDREGFGLTSLAFGLRAPRALYAGTWADGLFRSLDGGVTWDRMPRVFPNVTVTSIAIDPADPLTIYVAAYPPDVYKTVDGGASWTVHSDGIPSSVTSLNSLVLDPVTTATVYLTTTGAGVLKSSDGGGAWALSNAGLPLREDEFAGALAVDRKSHLSLYLQTSRGGFRSVDGGENWSAMSSLPYYVYWLATAATTPSTIFGGGYDSLYRSVDGGQTWPTTPTTGLAGWLTDLVFDPGSPSTVYVAGRTPVSTQGVFPPRINGVARSEDGGITWTLANDGIAKEEVFHLALDPRHRSHLFASTGTGIFATVNSGTSWFRISEAPKSDTEFVLSGVVGVDTAQPANIYVGTPGGGVFRRSAEVSATTCVADRNTLCLQGGRFRVRVTWSTYLAPYPSLGQTFPLTSDTGAFWFFTPNNLELVVKVLDGRESNGHFWVFAGALSDVAYAIVVTDTVTGAERTYSNPAGRVASSSDTSAF